MRKTRARGKTTVAWQSCGESLPVIPGTKHDLSLLFVIPRGSANCTREICTLEAKVVHLCQLYHVAVLDRDGLQLKLARVLVVYPSRRIPIINQ